MGRVDDINHQSPFTSITLNDNSLSDRKRRSAQIKLPHSDPDATQERRITTPESSDMGRTHSGFPHCPRTSQNERPMILKYSRARGDS